MKYRWCFGLGSLFLASLCGAEPIEPPAESAPYLLGRVDGKFPDSIEFRRDVVIGRAGGRELRVNIAYPREAKRPLPAVLYVHGGGWRKGTARTSGHIALLAQNGFFAMTVDYRLSDEAKWPAQIEDCKYAVRWVRAHAEELGIDPNRIGVWGTSAGGHLAACLGVMGDEVRLEGASGHADMSSRVQAVADSCGPTDFTAGSDGITGAKAGQSAAIVTELIGGTYEENPAQWKDASPLAYVKSGAPPFLIVHGDLDPVVPIRQSEKLEAALKEAGGSVEFLRVRNGGHSFQSLNEHPSAQPSIPAINDAIVDFFQRKL